MQSLTPACFPARRRPTCQRLSFAALATVFALGLSGCGGGDGDGDGARVLGATGLQRSVAADEVKQPDAADPQP